MHGMPGETRTLPHQAVLFGEERWDFAADEFVGDGFLRVCVEFVGVCHFPGAA